MVDGSKREDHLHLHLLDLQLTLLLFVTLDAHHALSWPGNVCLASSRFHWLAHSSFPMDKHNIEVLCWHGCSVPSEGVRQTSRKNMTLIQSGSNDAMSCSFRQPTEVCLSYLMSCFTG